METPTMRKELQKAHLLTAVLCFALSGFLVACLTTPAHAAGKYPVPPLEGMTLVWEDDFNDGRTDGWSLKTFDPADELGLVSSWEVPGKVDYCLRGASFVPEGGRGYIARSPELKKMGLDVLRPYVIRFWYKVPNRPARGTYTSCVRGANLMVGNTRCVTDRADFGWVENPQLNFRGVTQLSLDKWHHIEMRVHPVGYISTFYLLIDGEYVGSGRATCRDESCVIKLMDLPFDFASEYDPALRGGAYGGGYWDDFEVWAAPRERTPRFPPDFAGDTAGGPILSPNPFNPRTTISYELAVPGRVRLDVYAVNGRHVLTLCDRDMPTGSLRFEWDGRDESGRPVASGSYLARLLTPIGNHTMRMSLIK